MATEAQCACTMRGLLQVARSQDGYWEAYSFPGPCYQGIPALALTAREHELWVPLEAAGSHFIMLELSKARSLQPILFECLGSIRRNPRGPWRMPCGKGHASAEKAVPKSHTSGL